MSVKSMSATSERSRCYNYEVENNTRFLDWRKRLAHWPPKADPFNTVITRLSDFCSDERGYYPASIPVYLDLLEVALQTLNRTTKELPEVAKEVEWPFGHLVDVLWKFKHKFDDDQLARLTKVKDTREMEVVIAGVLAQAREESAGTNTAHSRPQHTTPKTAFPLITPKTPRSSDTPRSACKTSNNAVILSRLSLSKEPPGSVINQTIALNSTPFLSDHGSGTKNSLLADPPVQNSAQKRQEISERGLRLRPGQRLPRRTPVSVLQPKNTDAASSLGEILSFADLVAIDAGQDDILAKPKPTTAPQFIAETAATDAKVEEQSDIALDCLHPTNLPSPPPPLISPPPVDIHTRSQSLENPTTPLSVQNVLNTNENERADPLNDLTSEFKRSESLAGTGVQEVDQAPRSRGITPVNQPSVREASVDNQVATIDVSQFMPPEPIPSPSPITETPLAAEVVVHGILAEVKDADTLKSWIFNHQVNTQSHAPVDGLSVQLDQPLEVFNVTSTASLPGTEGIEQTAGSPIPLEEQLRDTYISQSNSPIKSLSARNDLDTRSPLTVEHNTPDPQLSVQTPTTAASVPPPDAIGSDVIEDDEWDEDVDQLLSDAQSEVSETPAPVSGGNLPLLEVDKLEEGEIGEDSEVILPDALNDAVVIRMIEDVPENRISGDVDVTDVHMQSDDPARSPSHEPQPLAQVTPALIQTGLDALFTHIFRDALLRKLQTSDSIEATLPGSIARELETLTPSILEELRKTSSNPHSQDDEFLQGIARLDTSLDERTQSGAAISQHLEPTTGEKRKLGDLGTQSAEQSQQPPSSKRRIDAAGQPGTMEEITVTGTPMEEAVGGTPAITQTRQAEIPIAADDPLGPAEQPLQLLPPVTRTVGVEFSFEARSSYHSQEYTVYVDKLPRGWNGEHRGDPQGALSDTASNYDVEYRFACLPKGGNPDECVWPKLQHGGIAMAIINKKQRIHFTQQSMLNQETLREYVVCSDQLCEGENTVKIVQQCKEFAGCMIRLERVITTIRN